MHAKPCNIAATNTRRPSLAIGHNAVTSTSSWFFWAVLSAIFAALTAIFAKIGVAEIDSDLATLLRTCVILTLLAIWVLVANKWTAPWSLPHKTLGFLLLSGLATGASWLCYFRALKLGEISKVAPIDKLSVVLVAVFAVIFLGERPDFKEWTGIALVALGVLTLAWKR